MAPATSERTILLFLSESVVDAEGDLSGRAAEVRASQRNLPPEVLSHIETVGRVLEALDSPDQQRILAVLRDRMWGISAADVDAVSLRSLRLASRYPGLAADSPVVARLLWLNQLYTDRLTVGLAELVRRVAESMWASLYRNDETERLLSELVSASLAGGSSTAVVGLFCRLVRFVVEGATPQPDLSQQPSVLEWGTDGMPRLTFMPASPDLAE